MVRGLPYHVEFADTSCVDAYSGCDSTFDFPFTSQFHAYEATLAMFDQVLIDGPQGNFDSDPSLTNGCGLAVGCWIETPFRVPLQPRESVTFIRAISAGLTEDSAIVYTSFREYDLGNDDLRVLALWTPIPEPGTAVLLALGLVGLARNRRDATTRAV